MCRMPSPIHANMCGVHHWRVLAHSMHAITRYPTLISLARCCSYTCIHCTLLYRQYRALCVVYSSTVVSPIVASHILRSTTIISIRRYRRRDAIQSNIHVLCSKATYVPLANGRISSNCCES